MSLGNRDIYILYGSQTGNSEDIAKDLEDKCRSAGIPVVCMTLNAAKKVTLKDVAKFLVVVCSTTGNGDSPENADAWWRTTKLRSAPKDTFAALPYAVLGLGDTNYDKFCHMGKSIDKRLEELGGVRSFPLNCADEATGLEEVVEQWKLEIMSVLQKVHSSPAAAAVDVPATNTKDTSNEAQTPDAAIASLSLAPSGAGSAEPAGVYEWDSVPAGVLSFDDVATALGISDKVPNAPEASQLPNYKKVLDGGPSVQIRDSANVTSGSSTQPPADGWTAEKPFHAAVAKAMWLTSADNVAEGISEWGEKKRVIHLEVDLAGSGIEYTPGDSIGVCCPNPQFLVDLVFQRLKEGNPELASASLDTGVVVASSGSDEDLMTLRELLTYRLDLTGLPRKTHVLALSEFCSNPDDVVRLQWLCSKGPVGKQLWSEFIESQGVGIAELLYLLPSCKPTLAGIVACCGNLPPRFYSIASSPLLKKNIAAVAFSSVRYTCGLKVHQTANGDSKYVIRRFGLCTSYLETLLRGQLSSSGATSNVKAVDQKIRVFLKPSIAFRLPGSVSHPLVLLGPGTGVAPFIGFLQHRYMLREDRGSSGDEISIGVWRGGFELEKEDLPHESLSVGQFIKAAPEGPIHLFFGCRNEGDYLYKEELASRVNDGTLSALHVAMSRVTNEKVYVTHKLETQGADIAQMILKEGGYVYICGDGNRMAKDVTAAILRIFQEHGGLSEDEASETLDDLKLRRRYVMDIWS